MHTFGDTAAGVPAFLAKLWRLVDDPDTNDLICWSKDGRSFIIQNQAKFARELLPLNYKHNNMASFIRQLNMYGFHKITSIENGGLKFDRDEMEFSHPCFKRNHPYLLEHIKRKIATSKTTDEKASLKPETVSKVLQDVRQMRGRQDSLDSRFTVMKQENEALWREIAALRQKHAKQQNIVNKLIQFLITIVQPAHNMSGVKRSMQLMINDIPESSKLRKTSESESELDLGNGHGPIIHELSEELLDEVADSVGVLYTDDCASPLQIERPHSSISLSSQNYDYSNQSAEDLFGTNPRTPGTPASVGNSSNSEQMQNNSDASSIIQSINPDGSQVVYHVTEIPDAHPPQAASIQMQQLFNDDNVLHTPMVREQLLKQKNRRRKQAAAAAAASGSPSPSNGSNNSQNLSSPQLSPVAKILKPNPIHQQQQQTPVQIQLQNQMQNQGPNPERKLHRPIQIKTEDSCDPMQFLNVFVDNNSMLGSPLTPNQQQQAQLISPNLSEDSRQSLLSNGGNGVNGGTPTSSSSPNSNPLFNVIVGNANAVLPVVNAPTMSSTINSGAFNTTTNPSPLTTTTQSNNNHNNSMDLYSSDFIENEIPNDIFEESTLLDGTDEGNNSMDSDLRDQQLAALQSAVNNGKFSAFTMALNGNGKGGGSLLANGNTNGTSAGFGSGAGGVATSNSNGNINENGASTSAAAAALANNAAGNSTANQGKDANDSNMAVAKYKKGSPGPNIDTRLSTYDDVNDHLDRLQDELESLKELLRNDGYPLDNNLLMTLFSDSDILGPYGLSLNGDERKGNELISYQPTYDLSDIISINNESNLDTAEPDVTSPGSSGLSQSVLNTPYHE